MADYSYECVKVEIRGRCRLGDHEPSRESATR